MPPLRDPLCPPRRRTAHAMPALRDARQTAAHGPPTQRTGHTPCATIAVMGAPTTPAAPEPVAGARTVPHRRPFPILFANGRTLGATDVQCECGQIHPGDGIRASVRDESPSIVIITGFCACPSCTLRSPIRERITALDDDMTLKRAHGNEWVLDAGMRDAESANTADTAASKPLSPVDQIRVIARIITLIDRRGR